MPDPNATAAAPAPTQAAPSVTPPAPAPAAPSPATAGATATPPASPPEGAVPASGGATAGKDSKGATGGKVSLKVPEGSLLEPADLDRIAAHAAAKGLSESDAQALVDAESKAVAEYSARQLAQLAEEGERWKGAAKVDAEIGGAKFDENIELARRFIDRFGSDDLKRALASTGLGNHPEFVRLCVRAGKAAREDTLVTSGLRGMPTKRDAADVLYGGQKNTP